MFAGDHGRGVMRIERVTVCLARGRAGLSSTHVNTLVKGHGRTAILRSYGLMRSHLRISGTFGTGIRRVRGLLGGHGGDSSSRGWRSV